MTRSPTRRIRFTRRDALKLASTGAAAAIATGVTAAGVRSLLVHDETAKGTCRFCTMHCGFVATVRGGELVRVDGDVASNTRGFLCEHGRALPEVVHGDARLRWPLRHVDGAFERTSWDAALADIGARLLDVRARHGASSLAVLTGWPFVRHPTIHLLHRFCRAFGTPNLATVASLCEASGRMGRSLVFGRNYAPDLAKVKTLLVWGGNPPRTAPPWAFLAAGVAKKPGGKLVVIDPVRTELAALADRHIAVRPGSDAVFALGMIRHVLAHELHDAAFVAANTVGLDELRALAEPWTPDRVAEATGTAPSDVVEVATLFATNGPAGIWDGLGLEHHAGGVDCVRLCASLIALCNHVDGQRSLDDGAREDGVLPMVLRVEQQRPVPPAPADKPLGHDEHPLFCAVHHQAHATSLFRAAAAGKLKALVVFGNNPLVTSPSSALVARALDALDLLVVVDPFLSETGERADFVLPAASFAEPSVVAPQGESRPDAEILFGLARACGLGAWFPWTSLDDAFDAKHGPRELVVDPWVREAMARGSSSTRFPTPSGKVELASTLLPRFGLPALPQVTTPSTSSEYPLVLVTGPRQRAYINSQFRRIPSVARLAPRPLARMHPSTAAAAGLVHGAQVRVVTAGGDAVFVVDATEDVGRGVVVVPHGWGGEADCNRLTPADGADPVSGFPRFRALACRVERQGAG